MRYEGMREADRHDKTDVGTSIGAFRKYQICIEVPRHQRLDPAAAALGLCVRCRRLSHYALDDHI